MIADLFAGPGGWDLGARRIGLHPIGYELDPHACATRAAAQLHTIPGDVTDADVPDRLDGLIASPPCQAFSMAGNGGGREDVEQLHRCILDWQHGRLDTDAYTWTDDRSPLVLEPLRWIDAHPTWLAFEQVPPVLELWAHIGQVLRAGGWSAWWGILNSADYGVPQTRKRAFLLAKNPDQHEGVEPPPATHAEHPEPSLFGPQLEPWVTMDAALGRRCEAWTADRPSTTIVGSFEPSIVAPPTYRGPGDGPRQSQPGAVKITEAEALTLQSFPADWPLQGPKTARFLQIGNAVPPTMAMHVLAAVTGLEVPNA